VGGFKQKPNWGGVLGAVRRRRPQGTSNGVEPVKEATLRGADSKGREMFAETVDCENPT